MYILYLRDVYVIKSFLYVDERSAAASAHGQVLQRSWFDFRAIYTESIYCVSSSNLIRRFPIGAVREHYELIDLFIKKLHSQVNFWIKLC